jgi:hypothetical protein
MSQNKINARLQIPIQWVVTLLIAVVGGTWAVFLFSLPEPPVGADIVKIEKRIAEIHQRIGAIEERVNEIHRRFITKDQFWEFKENFNYVRNEVATLSRQLEELTLDIKFLVAEAKRARKE